MRFNRSSTNRFSSSIWPGYVDAVTSLLMVIMFALTIAMVVQAVLRERIDNQDSELDQLGLQISQIAQALSASESREAALDRDLAAERDRLANATAEIAQARDEIDAQAEEARLAAARREALEALLADLRRNNAETTTRLEETQARLSDAEAARLTDAAAAAALRERLENSQAELTAMTLQLESARQEAEDTLTLLAAAESAREELARQSHEQVSEAERQAALLALANERLAEQQADATQDQRRVAALTQQVAQLNAQLANLQAVLNITDEGQREAALEVENLGQQLNAALLRAAEEERRRVELEREARERAEAEAADLSRYRSEFFGRLSRILEGREGVQVVGDRFVFSSEVLFPAGEAALALAGRDQIRNVTAMLEQISDEMPGDIDWIIRVDGHTDSQPLSGLGRYRDNWELSQARALAVVRYMIDELGFPPDRVAATGFADTRPVDPADTPEARALNRRIELKLTER